MSTRSCIARVTGEGKFTGVYHHWDSYPTALGATLYHLYHNHFHGDLEAMLAYLIDAHPAGWSTINDADFTQPAGFEENGFHTSGPHCYCHGGRHEDAQVITQDDDAGMEWAYVFDVEKRVMYVLERVYTDTSGHVLPGVCRQRWADAGTVELDKPAPNWAELTADTTNV